MHVRPARDTAADLAQLTRATVNTWVDVYEVPATAVHMVATETQTLDMYDRLVIILEVVS